MQKLTVGLIGNPNSGKTTLFNQLTGARQRVGNWAGVTVERKEGIFATTDHQVTLVDLPGTYSLTTISSQTSLDEQIACHYILSGDADMLINVVDASNLERNLYLTLQLLELGIPCVVALNMLDIFGALINLASSVRPLPISTPRRLIRLFRSPVSVSLPKLLNFYRGLSYA